MICWNVPQANREQSDPVNKSGDGVYIILYKTNKKNIYLSKNNLAEQ